MEPEEKGPVANEQAAGDDVRNLTETAEIIGVSETTLRKYIREGCPVRAGGSNGIAYELSISEVHAWIKARDDATRAAEEARRRENEQFRLDLGLGDLKTGQDAAGMTPRQQLEAMQAEAARVKLARDQGELILFEQAREIVTTACFTVSRSLMSIPDRMGAQFGWSEDEILACRGYVEAALSALSEGVAKLAAEGPRGA